MAQEASMGSSPIQKLMLVSAAAYGIYKLLKTQKSKKKARK